MIGEEVLDLSLILNLFLSIKRANHRGVAQSGSALAWGASGRRFKSSRPDQRGESQGSPLFISSVPSTLVILVTCALLCGCWSSAGRYPPKGEWVTITTGDSVSALSERFKVPQEDIVELNGLSDPSRILVGQRLFIPRFARDFTPLTRREVKSVSSRQSRQESSQKVVVGLASLKGAPPELMRELKWPIKPSLADGIGLSSGFGTRAGRPHEGIDLRAPKGTPVRAALSGEVVRSEMSQGGYGLVIYLQHRGGVQTRYAHHSRNLVKVGRHVRAGEVIAEVGSSGRSTGPHLHFEVRVRGEAINPLLLLPALPNPLRSSLK